MNKFKGVLSITVNILVMLWVVGIIGEHTNSSLIIDSANILGLVYVVFTAIFLWKHFTKKPENTEK